MSAKYLNVALMRKAIIKNLVLYIISAVLFFLFCGRVDVFRGWIYYLLVFSGAIINTFILVVRNPDVLMSRAKNGKNTQSWDKAILGVYFLLQVLIIPCLSGLDVRYGWTFLSTYYMIAGVLIYLFSLIVITRAMLVNRHFEGTVRIQEDRDHSVIDKGPYRYIRHPGNLGMVLSVFALPMIVGTAWALIPAFLAAFLTVVRTAKEDDFLKSSLKGYYQYTERVKHRLFPFVW